MTFYDSLNLISHCLAEVVRSPVLIVLNLVALLFVSFIFFVVSESLSANGSAYWYTGLSIVLAVVFFAYQWPYSVHDYYKEVEIPPVEFAHLFFLKIFPLLPLAALLTYVAAWFRKIKDTK
jgi:hypothetical protein